MTDQEQELINGLAERIRNAPAPQIDRDADDLIRRTIGSRPDALYILTQTVLLQEMALNQAKAQIDQMKQQSAPVQPQGSFLHGQPSSYSSSSYSSSSYQESPYAAPPQPPQSGGRFSGFLHNVAQTAAGVIAGEVAFDALSSLFGHRGGYYGGGGFFGGGGGISPGSETIINNYYDDDRDRDNRDDSRFADVADQNQNISSDIDDERDDSGDSFVDDGSSYDDSGSNDV